MELNMLAIMATRGSAERTRNKSVEDTPPMLEYRASGAVFGPKWSSPKGGETFTKFDAILRAFIDRSFHSSDPMFTPSSYLDHPVT